MQFFTVDRAGTLAAHSSLILFDDPLWLPYYEVSGIMDKETLRQQIAAMFPDGMSQHGWYYMKQRHTVGEAPHFSSDSSVLAELVVENVRRTEFPEHPSRFQSMFACDSPDEAKLFRNMMQCPSARIFEINATHSFRGDMNWLYLGVQNVASWYLARKYWSGESTPNPYWERIVKLPVQILSEVV